MNRKKRERILVLMADCGEYRLLSMGSRASAEIANLDRLPSEVAALPWYRCLVFEEIPRRQRFSACETIGRALAELVG